MSFLITASSIRRWAETTVARSTLPHLIRRLATATLPSNDIQYIHFPAYESVQRPGFDGEIRCTTGNSWIPAGYSIWELSVESGVGSKANEDYATRTEDTPEETRTSATYIALTARHWRDKKKWALEKSGEGKWKEVRAFDADDIEHWIEVAPFGLVTWFLGTLGIPYLGFDNVDEYWKSISAIGSVTLTPQVFLAGRRKNIEALDKWLNSEPTLLQINCRSLDEFKGFVCAYLISVQAPQCDLFLSRAVIVASLDSWQYVRDSTRSSIIIIDPALQIDAVDAKRAVKNGHHVILSKEPSFLDRGESSSILQRTNRFELRDALQASGYSPGHADQLSRSAGGSLAILKRQLTRNTAKHPDWTLNIPPEILGGCILLGGWTSSAGDKSAFEEITSRSYSECEPFLQQMSASSDPLLLSAAGNWRVLSKDNAWDLFGDRVTPASIAIFEDLAIKVLTDDDPRYELPERDRPYAQILGKVTKYSDTLKQHVAETLAFLGAFEALIRIPSVSTPEVLGRIVSVVLSPERGWERWASVGRILPLLAEASPQYFISSIQSDIKSNEPCLHSLFHEEEDAFFGRCNHAGILWALETLAWKTQYLPNVIGILITFASKDVGKKWGNRPSESIRNILRSWFPQTTATTANRISCLDIMIRTDSDAAWPILVDLLPQTVGAVSFPNPFPYWQEWANDWEPGVTSEEASQFENAVAARIIGEAKLDATRWGQIFENICRFPDSSFDRLLGALDIFSVTTLTDDIRRLLYNQLNEQINNSRSFARADWALSEEQVAMLTPRLDRLLPEQLIFRHVHLFDEWPKHFLDREASYQENEAALLEARVEAVNEVIQQGGFTAIENMLDLVKSPGVLGRIVSISQANEFELLIVPSFLATDEKRLLFAAGFVFARFQEVGWPWIDFHLERCESDFAKANLLRCLKFNRDAWNRVAESSEAVKKQYWETCRAFNPDLESEDISFAVEKLVAAKRPAICADLLSMALHQKRLVSSETLLSPLEFILTLQSDELQAELRILDTYDIVKVLEELQTRDDFEQDRLINLEWNFISMLDRHNGHSPRALINRLSTSPEFFSEVLSYIYRSTNVEDELPQTLESRPAMATSAFRLLHHWDRIPGTREDGSIDESQLMNWCIRARSLAQHSGRVDVCDSNIGQILARSTAKDAEGRWPCEAVRNVFSAFPTDPLRRGMYVGILNKRDGVFRASGGSRERNLAQEFRSQADSIRFEAFELADLLDSIARYYERDALSQEEEDHWDAQ